MEESVKTSDSHLPTADTEMDLPATVPEDQQSGPYTPPPHIAARFYRPSQSRRKGSAASSRRNSISSAHSRSSHGFTHHDGDQSKYIAQQLRRASILEDRKARLADRAAHAEKVRLRAQLAKANPHRASASEERALAAAQAREKNLAEIVAACAEEVKHAKAVAESMKEKRESELQQLRLQIDERMAEAEKRREELRKTQAAARRSRGSSLGTKKPEVDIIPEVTETESPSLTTEMAVARIQRWWKMSMRSRVVRRFAELGLNIDRIRNTPFETVVELVRQPHVLTATAGVLRICGLREGKPGSVEETVAVRTFLSAFLILGHPTQVLTNKDDTEPQTQLESFPAPYMAPDDIGNPQSQEVVAKARDLLIAFENALSQLTTSHSFTPTLTVRDALSETYATFHNAFIAWKARDSNALIEVMLMQFVELDAILETVREGSEEPVTETYRQSIRSNQLELMVRVKRLAGAQHGKEMVFDAVRQARKARAAKKPAKHSRPRAAEGSFGGGNSKADQATAAQVVSSQLQTLTPPPTPPSGQESKRPLMQLIYPPILPENRVIVHELAINREYRIEEEHFKEQHKLRMKPLLEDLRASHSDAEKESAYFVLMAKYIKDRLQHLVPPGTPTHKRIGEMLDIDLQQQQLLAGSFSFDSFFESMSKLLPQLCAPVRDERAKVLVNEELKQGRLVDRLEALISFIDLMLCDYSNYMLEVAAPSLTDHASSYEAKRFAEDLERGVHDLSKAEASWRVARRKVHAEAARRDPEGVSHPRSRPTPDKVYWQMLVDELTQPCASLEAIPEPLNLDGRRASRLGLQTLRIATAAAILLQCKNMLKRDVRAPWKTEASRIFTVLESMDDATKNLEQSTAVDGIMAALEAGRSMPAVTKKNLHVFVTKVIAAGCEAKSNNTECQEPVCRLLLTRVRGHILGRLQVGSATDKVKATSTAGEKLASLGMTEFVEKVRELVDEIGKVGAIDREAHGSWWESVSDEVEEEEEEMGDTGASLSSQSKS